MTETLAPPADITVDGTGLLCVILLLRLRARIDDAAAGTVVHVIATDPAAPLDLHAWCHMTASLTQCPVTVRWLRS
ncbi:MULTISPECIES: sulfurtransferase TusA family protein [Streptomyces]|uniref:sulfurtransferase TusA family protein n=1 Tax=Streptomyces TaxID=1883 RepID=UPI000462F120|nr:MULTISPECIES: sulfurtransferase TusA family protein [Streptomyces]